MTTMTTTRIVAAIMLLLACAANALDDVRGGSLRGVRMLHDESDSLDELRGLAAEVRELAEATATPETMGPTDAATLGPTDAETEVPSTDVPSTDVPSTEVPSTDVPSTDVPSETMVPSEETMVPSEATMPPSDVTGVPTSATVTGVPTAAPVATTTAPTEESITIRGAFTDSPTEAPVSTPSPTVSAAPSAEYNPFKDYYGGTYQVNSTLFFKFWKGKGTQLNESQIVEVIHMAHDAMIRALNESLGEDFESLTECRLEYHYDNVTETLTLHFFEDVKLSDDTPETLHSVAIDLAKANWADYLHLLRKKGLIRGGVAEYTACGDDCSHGQGAQGGNNGNANGNANGLGNGNANGNKSSRRVLDNGVIAFGGVWEEEPPEEEQENDGIIARGGVWEKENVKMPDDKRAQA